MTYRDTLVSIADTTADRVVAIVTSWQDGDLTEAEAIGLIAAVIARANGLAVSLADLSLAAVLMDQLDRPVATLGLAPPADDTERLTKAAGTLLAVTGLTAERAARLGRSEPLAAAAAAYSEGITARPEVVGWTRQARPDACEACTALTGDVLPDTTPMWHHPGCTCIQQPITQEETR